MYVHILYIFSQFQKPEKLKFLYDILEHEVQSIYRRFCLVSEYTFVPGNQISTGEVGAAQSDSETSGSSDQLFSIFISEWQIAYMYMYNVMYLILPSVPTSSLYMGMYMIHVHVYVYIHYNMYKFESRLRQLLFLS